MKKRENFTIDEDLMKDFEKYVASESISKSATVENLIREFLSSKKKKSDLIEKEQVDKLNELVDELNNYKDKIQDLSSALYEVMEDEICCELLKERELYTELHEVYMNLPLDYDYLAYELESVYVNAVDVLKKKKNAKFLLKDYLSDELSPVDEYYITENGIDYDEWVEENEKLGLDINRYKYLINPNIFDAGNIYYFGDKIASKLELAPNIRCHDTFGIKRIAEREILYAKDGDCLRFNPDFNQFALYYFLKDYKEIDTDKVFEIFEGLYYSITETGIEKIPTEVIDYVTQYSPYTTEEIIKKLKEILNKDLNEDDMIEVYKYTQNENINLKNNLIWNINDDSIDENSSMIKGKVKVKDIVSISDDCSGEIFTKYNSVKTLNLLMKSGVTKEISIDLVILAYIYCQGNDTQCSFELDDLVDYLDYNGVSVTKDELQAMLLKLIINDGTETSTGKYSLCGFSSIEIEGDTVFITK